MGKRIEFDRAKAEELYKQGVCPAQIGKDLNVNSQTVIAHLKKVGIYIPKTRPTAKSSKIKSVDTLVNGKSKVKTKSTNKKKTSSSAKPKKKKKDDSFVSKKEKIAYCNRVYGKGNWRFMSKEEVIDALTFDQEMRNY